MDLHCYEVFDDFFERQNMNKKRKLDKETKSRSVSDESKTVEIIKFNHHLVEKESTPPPLTILGFLKELSDKGSTS